MAGPDDKQGGISLSTLAIASAASALSAAILPMIWKPGTIPAAAAAPVVVALVSEALKRPAAHVSAASRLVRDAGGRLTTAREADERRRRRLRLAAITGAIAFLLVAAVWTVTELAVGEAVTGSGRTTFFGGADPAPGPAAPDPGEPAGATPGASPAPEPTGTATPTPEPEVTPDPEATPTPPASAAPEATPPPPAEATPAPG